MPEKKEKKDSFQKVHFKEEISTKQMRDGEIENEKKERDDRRN